MRWISDHTCSLLYIVSTEFKIRDDGVIIHPYLHRNLHIFRYLDNNHIQIINDSDVFTHLAYLQKL